MRIPVDSITAHIAQEIPVIQLIEDMVHISGLKPVSVGSQCRQVNVVHIIIFNENSVITIFVGITQH